MNIRKSPMGVEVSIRFKTDLGTDQQVSITYSNYGISPAVPESLNADGVKALRQALDLAVILHEQNYLME